MIILGPVLVAAALLAAATASAAPIDVTRLGARPNDGADDTAAFAAAFATAHKTGARRIEVPAGRYVLTAAPGSNVLFNVEGLDGLEIVGHDAELVMRGVTGLFQFSRCQGVSIRGLKIDCERPPFSVGKVLAATPRTFDLEIGPEFPVVGGEPVGAFMDHDPETGLPALHGLDVYGGVDRTELLRPQVLRIHLNREIPVAVGRLVVLRHQVYGYNAFVFSRCSDVRVDDTTVYATPGMALVALVCRNVSLKRFNVLIRPGTSRLMTATADACHFGGCKGTVSLEGCVFEAMGDDGANVKSGLYLTVRRRLDASTVIAQHNLKMIDLPDPGDRLEVSKTSDLIPFATADVKAATVEPGSDGLIRVEFAGPLPEGLEPGDVLGNASRAPRFRMSGCTVRRNRARGVLCQTRDAIIENCLFQQCTSAGVLVLTEVTYFHESIGTRDVIVRGCRFEGCNYGAAGAEGALSALAWLKDMTYPPKPGVHRGVRFQNNVIRGTEESAIFAVGVDGLTVRGNHIEQACRTAARPNGRAAIDISNSARVDLKDNAVPPNQQGPGFREAVRQTNVTK